MAETLTRLPVALSSTNGFSTSPDRSLVLILHPRTDSRSLIFTSYRVSSGKTKCSQSHYCALFLGPSKTLGSLESLARFSIVPNDPEEKAKFVPQLGIL